MKLKFTVTAVFTEQTTKNVPVLDSEGKPTGEVTQQTVPTTTVRLVPASNAESPDNAAFFEIDGFGWLTLQPAKQSAASSFAVGQTYEIDLNVAA